jgi:acyl-coenzyme A synthetase/AMP-(fatty) acid ligase
MSLLNGIFLRARTDPHKPAILLPDRVITYGMIATGTLSVEQKLKQLGVTRGEWAAIDIANPARHLILLLALWRLGIPSASIRRDLVAPALAASCKLFFCEALTKSSEDVRQFVVTEDWFTRPAPDTLTLAESAFAADDVCRVTFTSGSSGIAKPIAHSESAYERRVFDTLITSFQRPWTRLLIMGDLSVGFGSTRTLQTLWLGLTVSFPMTPDDALRMISHFCIETIMGSPLHVLDFLERQEQTGVPLSSLTSIQFGGAAMGIAGLVKLRNRFGADLLEEYASTEASIAGIASGELLDLRQSGPPVFAPILPVEVVQDGARLPAEHEGEIRIRSPSLGTPFDGSLKCPPNDGWFYPGDRGVIRSDGLFSILGRTGNVINAGGVKLNAEAIEELVSRHPRIRDVAVLGAQTDSRTQVRAVVVTSAPCTSAEIVSWIRRISPETIVDDVQFTDTIPRTATRKIARDILAKMWGQM